MYLVVAVFPRDRPQCRDLSANCEIQNSSNLVRRHGVDKPPEHNRGHADRNYARDIDLGRPRESAEWSQDAGILDRASVPRAV